MSRIALCAVSIVITLLLAVAATHATTFIPPSIEDLTRSSVASAIGSVRKVRSVQARGGAIFTLIDVRVEQVIHGELPAESITLREIGGSVAGRHEVWFGTPSFRVGEQVFLFLTIDADGSLRTNHFALGKYRLENDTAGTRVARRTLGSDTTLIVPRGAAPPNTGIPLDDLIAAVRRAGNGALAERRFLSVRAAPPEAEDAALPTETASAFTLAAPVGRLFEVDEGRSIRFRIDARGDSILGVVDSLAAIDAALAVWTDVETAAIELRNDGPTDDLSADCAMPHRVRFDDPPEPEHPQGIIPPPVNCSGTLGLGGFCATSAELKTLHGTTFVLAARAMLTLADGWDGCAVWTPCNLAEIATHEIGHGIGLGHSSDKDPESDPALADATMYFLAHFDGRCADLRQDDRYGISFIYPTDLPPAIQSPRRLPDAFDGEPYFHTLAAQGGSGALTWSLVAGGFPGLELSANGVISGTPLASGSSFFRAVVADEAGDSHTANFDLTVLDSGTPNPATVTPTETPLESTPTATVTFLPSATATPEPSPTSTPSGTATSTHTPSTPPSPTLPPDCTGDCTGERSVTVDELVRGVNIALGIVSVGECVPFDADANGQVTIDELITGVNNALRGCPV